MGSNGLERTRWDLVSEIFLEALEQPTDVRAGWIAERCADLPELIVEVRDLLDAHEASGDFLSALDPLRAMQLMGDVEQDGAPQYAGPFKLIQELGRGGMGVVYLGERSDGEFDRRVAVKVIKRGMDSDAIKNRFLRERQILANLEHPNIGRLYDGGVTNQGQPYFAMEYVDGLPLTEFCDRHELTIDDRLTLFNQACLAVQYAHQNLVVHRDLKPSNMLVTDDGRVKLLDFGIAKVLSDTSTTGIQTITDLGQRVLTPEYASPEQLLGRSITTASDVYSLGVVLFELLSGHRPYEIGRGSAIDIERNLSETRILAPSAMVRQPPSRRAEHDGEGSGAGSEDASQIAARRGVQPARLSRRLRGDLDTIILKALRRDPERRYSSVEGLIEDLRRHRNGLPIKARPESVWYRVRKFTKRHVVAVSVATLVALLLLGAVVVSVNLARQKTQESIKAQQVTEFMASLFASSDPDRSRGTEITVLELLDEGSKRIETELEGQPEVQADLMEVMAQVYLKLGLYEKSEVLNRTTLALRHSVYGERNPLVARSLHRIGFALRGQGRYDESTVFLKQALEMQRDLLGPESEDLATTLYDLAWIENRRGNYEDAEDLNRQAVAIFETRRGHDSESVARGLYNIAWIQQKQGRYQEAAETYRESLALFKELVGVNHRSVAKGTSGLATALQDMGRYDEAEQLHREALEIRLKVLPADHPDVATSLNNLAAVLREKKEYTAAAEYFQQACDIYLGRLGGRHLFTTICMQNVGSALAGAGRLDEAIPILRDVLRTRIELQGADHPELATTHIRLGDALNLDRQFEEAEQHLKRAVDIRITQLGADHPETASAQVHLAVVERNRGNEEEASRLLEEALRIQIEKLGPDHPVTVETQQLLKESE